MRIIPKKVKVKNTVWKCYSMVDVIVALVVFAVIFIAITAGNWIFAVIMGLIAVVMFMPTPDGIFYTFIFENVKFLFAKKKYTVGATNAKEKVDTLIDLKEIKENGLIGYNGGNYGRVIKVGQKNFGIEGVVQQNIDINYFANALKLLDQNQSADIVKIDRPVNLDGFAKELFDRLSRVPDSDDESDVKDIKKGILRERIDRIDKLNNIRKQYLSDYYIVVYGRNELDLESMAVNIAAEIAKCGLSTKLLGMRDTAVFLRYSYSRNFDEREVKDIADDNLLEWVKPKEIVFSGNKYEIDGTEASVLAVSDYPLRVKNAWGAELFNIPNTKVVMHIKPIDKFKAIKRIDKCIGEMQTKQIISDKASEANSAETHQETMNALLDALQTENESLFDVTLTITAYNYLKDENYKKAVRRAMLTGNFRPSTLYGLQIDGFKTAAVSPTNTLKNYERGINSSSLAAAFPFVRTFVMDEGGILLGENKTNGYPFIFNLWKRGNLYQWNKNRIDRVIKNEKYIGAEGYPAIIPADIFAKANFIKEEKGTKRIVQDDKIEYLKKVVICNECGKRLRRIPKWRTREKWICVGGCKNDKYVDDGTILTSIKSVINRIKSCSELYIEDMVKPTYNKTMEIVRCNNELSAIMNESAPNFKIGKKVILEMAAMKFKACTYVNPSEADKVLSLIMDIGDEDNLSYDFLHRVIKQVAIEKSGAVIVEFIGGTKIACKY